MAVVHAGGLQVFHGPASEYRLFLSPLNLPHPQAADYVNSFCCFQQAAGRDRSEAIIRARDAGLGQGVTYQRINIASPKE